MNAWAIPAVAFALAAAAVALLLYALTAGRRRMGQRIGNLGADGAAVTSTAGRGDPFPGITSLLERRGRHSAIEIALERAGLNWRPSEFVVAGGAVVVLLAAAGWLLWGPLGAAAGIVVGVALPYLGLVVMQARRLRAFERQLPDALMLIASTLRSGYGILRALQAVRDEMAPPISVEFGKTLDETNVGVPTGERLVAAIDAALAGVGSDEVPDQS